MGQDIVSFLFENQTDLNGKEFTSIRVSGSRLGQ